MEEIIFKRGSKGLYSNDIIKAIKKSLVKPGNGKILLIGLNKLVEEGFKLLNDDTYFFLEEKPE